jgi:hypothetical protein
MGKHTDRCNSKDSEFSKDSYIDNLFQSDIIPNPDDVDDFPLGKKVDVKKYHKHLFNAEVTSLKDSVIKDEYFVTLPDCIKEMEGNRKKNKNSGFWEATVAELDKNSNDIKR